MCQDAAAASHRQGLQCELLVRLSQYVFHDQLAVLTPEHSVLEAMDLMLRYNVRHVPVVSTCLGKYAHTYTCGATDQAQRAQCAACAC
jgi:hypothetical protein